MASPRGTIGLLASIFRRLLAHPLTAGLDLDDPTTTQLRKQIISSKRFLTAVYDEWYRRIAAGLPAIEGTVLELGSGAGHCDRHISHVITSEVFFCSTIQLVADAQRLPFSNKSLRAIVFTNVMHHMPDVCEFLKEASRCLREGGRILMIEPWVTPWSRFVYTRFHHEPFCPEATDWTFPSTGPLSGANGAIPWIVFVRDRKRFEAKFPEFEIQQIKPFMPLRYLVSGGVGMRSLMPGFSHSIWERAEKMLEPHMSMCGMFAFISLGKR